jgi:hypothetical protein
MRQQRLTRDEIIAFNGEAITEIHKEIQAAANIGDNEECERLAVKVLWYEMETMEPRDQVFALQQIRDMITSGVRTKPHVGTAFEAWQKKFASVEAKVAAHG